MSDRRALEEDMHVPSAPAPVSYGLQPIPQSAVTFQRYNGGGSIDDWIKQACLHAGVPYNDNWRVGYETICMRESSDDPNAVNNYDSNAIGPTQSDGNPFQCSRGDAQCIPQTFAAFHCAGCSNDIYDAVACIASSIRYVMSNYGVSADASNFASRVQQADPSRSPAGY